MSTQVLTAPSCLSSPQIGTNERIPQIGPNERIPALDGLRGIASLMVVFLHFGPHIVRRPESAFQFLHFIPKFWLQGVDLFFVLSGFLISGILVNARNSPTFFQTFYARRAFRIFPLYYLVFLSYCAALLFFGARASTLGRLFENPLPVWYYAAYLQNLPMAMGDTFGPVWMAASWSLAVEEQFYFTFPAIVRFVSERNLFRLTIAAIFFAPVLRCLIQKFKFMPGQAGYVLLPTSIDSLAVGVLVMLLLRKRGEYLRTQRKLIARCVMAAFALWTIYPYVPNPQAVRMAFLDRTASSLVFGGILLHILLSPRATLARFLSRSGIRNLGNMAYSTYLFHPILLCIAFRLMRGKDPYLNTLSDIPGIAVALAATFALSFASWTFFERRLVRIGHQIQY